MMYVERQGTAVLSVLEWKRPREWGNFGVSLSAVLPFLELL
jgi:hypothetical protein